MTRRVCAWTAAGAAVLSLLAASPAVADETASPPTASEPQQPTGEPLQPAGEPLPASEPADSTPAPADPVVTDPPPTQPSTPPTGGGEVTVPDSEAPSEDRARLLVFGDSISATYRYSRDGSPHKPKAWWARVAEAAGLPADEVMVSAEGGSGLVARGDGLNRRKCGGTTFGDRLGRLGATRPDVVMVQVGRNDIRSCALGKRVAATSAERRQAATKYFTDLARAADQHGVKRSNVYVMTVWGSSYSDRQVAIAHPYETSAKARGFSWIPLPALIRAETNDSTHPNARGTSTIARSVVRGSDVVTAIRSRGTKHARVPAREQVLCSTLRTCRAMGARGSSEKPTRKRVWGTVRRTPSHRVADRLTRNGRFVAPVLGAKTAREWRTAAIAQRAATAFAHAKPGDVAWWRTAPNGAGVGPGHVAIVERVAANNSWVVVSETTTRGARRSVRYSGPSLPRAYLRFSRTNGGPRGHVIDVRGTRRALVVRGRAVDTDIPHRGVGIRVVVTQRGRTWTSTAARRPGPGFKHRFRLPGLRRGVVTVRTWAVNTPGTKGSDRRLATQRVRVR